MLNVISPAGETPALPVKATAARPSKIILAFRRLRLVAQQKRAVRRTSRSAALPAKVRRGSIFADRAALLPNSALE